MTADGKKMDIVARLRTTRPSDAFVVMIDAAGEIERLRSGLREISGGLNIQGLTSDVLLAGDWHTAYRLLQEHATRTLEDPTDG